MVEQDRVPPGQTVTRLFPVLHYGTVPKVDLAQWTFQVFGHVKSPLTLAWSDFMGFPQQEVQTDIHCVTGWSKFDTRWKGVSTRVIWERLEPEPAVTHVMVHGHNGFTANLSVADFLAERSMFAYLFDGKPLEPEHGGPMRLVVPHLYFWKSAKWVTGLELLTEDEPGFWEDRGYHMRGDPWKEERYW